MELAIPFIALGGLYVISNQKNQACEQKKDQLANESFVNMGVRSNLGSVPDTTKELPNTNTPVQNYPVTNMNQLLDSTQAYPNPNQATDKYFDQSFYQNRERQGEAMTKTIPGIYSLSGNYLDSAQFKHNNMVPFNGGKVKGHTYDVNITESVLDNMVGAGSQTIKKIEQAPLFKPEENMAWAYGTPNNSDFFQSRVNPGGKNNVVKPFDSVRVGPGLDQGYTTAGTGGYNSGMEARDKWLPKTVDQLRADTNPKLEYMLVNHEGPANSFIKNAATTQMLGRVEKQRPDTYFINTQDRWLTTTGAVKGETLRPIQEMGVVRRADISTDYMGPAGACDVKATYAPENFEPSKRLPVLEGGVNCSAAVGRGPSTDTDNYMRSHTNYENNRSIMPQPDTFRSGFSGAIGAVIAPIMDILRPSRKEETVSNVRVYGEAGTTVPKGYVYNTNDVTGTTVKETTLYAPTFNIDNQKEGIYVNNYTAPEMTQRNSTSVQYYNSAGGYATGYGAMNTTAAYNQHNNNLKPLTIDNRPNQGGTQIFNQYMNVDCHKQDCNRFDGRMNPAISATPLPPSVQTYGAIHAPQTYNENINCERISPDLLSAFRNNPYTHSLTSAV